MRVWMCGDLHRHPVALRCRMHCHYQQLTSMIKKQNVISLFVAFQLTFLITSFPHTPTRHPLDHIPKMASSEQDCMMQSTNQCFCLVPFVDRKSKPPACFVVYRLTFPCIGPQSLSRPLLAETRFQSWWSISRLSGPRRAALALVSLPISNKQTAPG